MRSAGVTTPGEEIHTEISMYIDLKEVFKLSSSSIQAPFQNIKSSRTVGAQNTSTCFIKPFCHHLTARVVSAGGHTLEARYAGD